MNGARTPDGLMRVGVLSSHSRFVSNGISRYQWRIIDSLALKRIQFVFFNLRNSETGKHRIVFQALGMVWRFLGIAANVRRSSVDVFWGPAHRLPFVMPKDTPCVLTIHDLAWKKVGATMPAYRRVVESIIMPFSLRRADIIITVSQSTADDVLRYYPECVGKVRVIPLASSMESIVDIEPSGLQPLIPDELYVLFVGTIEPRKNIINLLTAFSELPAKIRSEYKLVVVGDKGWGRLRLHEKIMSLGLTGSILMLGQVTEPHLKCLYRNAYCLAMPSLYEGFGLPIVEAQSFGVPVITSNCSSMPEVAADGAIYVDPFDVGSISNALQTLLSDRALRDELSRRSLINSQRFSWERSAQLTLDAFSDAFDRNTKL